jgi:HAD superfamily hydrolase (TIGR01509 family)
MMPRAVAWDIDGTLVDSEPVHLMALQKVCADHGVDIADLPDDRFIGVHVKDVWRALAPRFPQRLSEAEWVGELNGHYLGLAKHLQPMPGAVAVVSELARRGIPQVAVSNSNRAVVQANLSVCNLVSHLAFSISLDDVTAGKPDPAPYLQAARRLALAPHDILAVEDSLTGLRSARSAGLQTLGYGDGAALGAVAHRTIGHLDSMIGALELAER